MSSVEKYKVRPSINSEVHMFVYVTPYDISKLGEQEAVGEAAWLALLDNERDGFGQDTGRASPTARVLRKLCVIEGEEKIKNQFVQSIVFEKVDNDKTH
jgi:hypothetical protein